MTHRMIDRDPSATREWRSFGTARLWGFTEGAPDDRPPLLFLHGLTFDHRMWLPAIAVLQRCDPGRRVLVLDLPGHGASPILPICDLDNVAAAVASAADDAGLGRPIIVGHSMSAIIAAVYAGTYRTGGVVDVDQELDPSFIRMLQANRDAVTGPRFEQQVWPALLDSMRIDLLPEDGRRHLNTDLHPHALVLAYWREALDTPLPALERRVADILGRVRQSAIPVLIVAGHPYEETYSTWLQQALPEAAVTVVPDSGHFPHLADPDRFAALLAETGRWRAAGAGPS